MKKFFALSLAVLLTLSASAAKVYFVNSPKWTTVNAYMWTNGGEMSWPGKTMTKETGITCSKGDVYSIDAGTYVNIIFNCGNGCSQTGDLTLDAAKPYWYEEQCYASIKEIEGQVEPTPVPGGESAVPSQCPDVMLQGFYWDSYRDSGFGDTKWKTLTSQASELGKYFSLIWLPPSCKGTSNPGMGYIASQYSDQNSSFGTVMDLRSLIVALHNNGTKVIADIVINHCGNASSWCDFKPENFSPYGSFNPQGSWITKNDEVSSASGAGSCKTCSTNSNMDDGYGDEANYGAARDWDHKNSNVQAMCKAYLQWMKGKMLYDGFRYDYCKGFASSHINDYNKASQPYFSVMEYWDGNVNTLKSRIDGAGKNTLTFDFAAKYSVFRDGIYKKLYNNLKTGGLRPQGYSKYAVTFIDNHDTFDRGNGGEVTEAGNGSSVNNADVMIQCNAYLLSMPGVPCVFYPHWVKYKSEIQAMIQARWIAGVHSESQVKDETSGSGFYKATIVGKTGEIRLLIGANSDWNTSPGGGYIKAYAGHNCGVYYKGTGAWPRVVETDLIPVQQETTVVNNKFLIDGKLYFRSNGALYDVLGNRVRE